MVTAFDGDVVKADTVIFEELKTALQQAVQGLEDSIQSGQKDYHPGSDGKVVDLVHPSLFPLVYGRSRILKDTTVGLDDFLAWSGTPEVIPVPPEEEADIMYRDSSWRPHRLWRNHDRVLPFSRKFQWLPCDVEFEKSDGCRISSYINNLRPDMHRDLYPIIEKIIAQTIPLWNRTLTPVHRDYYDNVTRIAYYEAVTVDGSTPEPQQDEGEDSDDFSERHDEWRSSRPPKQPEPDSFNPKAISTKQEFDLRTSFQDKGLQVIVKLANIELTPEKPRYEGGSWHVEGQLVRYALSHYYISCPNSNPERAHLRDGPLLLL